VNTCTRPSQIIERPPHFRASTATTRLPAARRPQPNRRPPTPQHRPPKEHLDSEYAYYRTFRICGEPETAQALSAIQDVERQNRPRYFSLDEESTRRLEDRVADC